MKLVELEDWEAAKKVGIKKTGWRMELLWTLSEKKGAGETYSDKKPEGHVKGRTQEREGLVGSIGSFSSWCLEDLQKLKEGKGQFDVLLPGRPRRSPAVHAGRCSCVVRLNRQMVIKPSSSCSEEAP